MAETSEFVTPRSWPENAEPTESQLADWLAICTPVERIAFVRHARHRQDISMRCFMEDHKVALAFYRDRYEDMRNRVEQALSLLLAFDPTSGSARARTFVADLRNVLGLTDD